MKLLTKTVVIMLLIIGGIVFMPVFIWDYLRYKRKVV